MGFKAKSELNGEVDKNINTAGRIKGAKALTRRQIKERELLTLARKIKPLMADAINTAATIMRNNEATHASQLKACVILLDAYKELVDDLYQDDPEDKNNEKPAEEIQEQKPLFSLTVVDKVE
jgi:hypothetical protein